MNATVPDVVLALARGRAVRLVWENEIGGRTYAVGDCYVKWSPRTLVPERLRLDWAAAFVRVPRVLDGAADGSWLVTEALSRENAVAERWRRDPERAVVAIGSSLRAFHDALPVDECPFTWSLAERLASVRVEPERWHDEHRELDVEAALRILRAPPAIDRLVVCHGDACAPNTLLDEDGSFRGHVDLGALGVADRWADLAIATWSCDWNYGPGWDGTLLRAYGVEPDPMRTAYYRLLWDLGP
jgi:kanamycin kinase